MNLNNKVTIITGGAKGLGKALACELLRFGAFVILIDKNKTALKEFFAVQKNDKIKCYFADVSDEEEIKNVSNEILIKFDKIDILINNAGISMSSFFDETVLNDFNKVIDTNFKGTVNCTKYFLPLLKNSSDARLVNIISDFALMGFPAKTAYAASKSAVLGFSNSLRTELIGTNIKVSIVIPPPLDTDLIMAGKHIDERKKNKESEFLQKYGMPLQKAARKIIRGILSGKYRIVTGIMMKSIDLLSRFFPSAIHYFIGKSKKRFDFV